MDQSQREGRHKKCTTTTNDSNNHNKNTLLLTMVGNVYNEPEE